MFFLLTNWHYGCKMKGFISNPGSGPIKNVLPIWDKWLWLSILLEVTLSFEKGEIC
jgi:hypothetical protein